MKLEWISVEDRLPRLHQEVVGYNKISGAGLATFSTFDGGSWNTGRGVYPLTSYPHWMPLPPPPDEE